MKKYAIVFLLCLMALTIGCKKESKPETAVESTAAATKKEEPDWLVNQRKAINDFLQERSKGNRSELQICNNEYATYTARDADKLRAVRNWKIMDEPRIDSSLQTFEVLVDYSDEKGSPITKLWSISIQPQFEGATIYCVRSLLER